MATGIRVAVVGAASAVGQEIVRILEERGFPVQELVPLEMKGSHGGSVQFLEQEIPIRALDGKMFKGIDLAFFASGQKASMEYARSAVREGAVVIDTSVAFRLDRDVPLVVPEINAHLIPSHRGIIASPMPCAIQLALVVWPIYRKAGVKRIVTSTYQAVSDAGEGALNELSEQITELFNFQETRSSVFQHQIAFNAIPQTGAFLDNGYTTDEVGILVEMRKIMGDDGLRVSATTVHVPVFYSHSQSVSIDTDKAVAPDDVRKILKSSPGVAVEDNPAAGIYPLAVYATGKDECFVGRIRQDISSDTGIVLWTAMDNLRKGTALNAVQIAEHVVAMKQ